MSREERQALLHEGVSVTTTLSAYGAFTFFVQDMCHSLSVLNVVRFQTMHVCVIAPS